MSAFGLFARREKQRVCQLLLRVIVMSASFYTQKFSDEDSPAKARLTVANLANYFFHAAFHLPTWQNARALFHIGRSLRLTKRCNFWRTIEWRLASSYQAELSSRSATA